MRSGMLLLTLESYVTCFSFLSCLITGVLTHHLSWASTVAPVGDTPASTYLDKHMAKWVSRPSDCTVTLQVSSLTNPLAPYLSCLVFRAVQTKSSSSRVRVIYHNWSTTKQRLHPQSVAVGSRDKPPFSFVRGQDSTM